MDEHTCAPAGPPPGAASGTWPVTAVPPAVIAALEGMVAGFQAAAGPPGVAWGLVAGGSLVHAGGAGECWLGGPPPGAGTVFRIASMTKSFTAAAVLALRDEGRLRLDDPAAAYIPDLHATHLASPDSPDVTIRQLLTMTGGFPTDDPWGDRQQGLPLAGFAELIRGGLRQAWAPGTRFEYANLGYALLGLVIAAAAGTGYREFVTTRLLEPLGLARTGFEEPAADGAGLARGHQRGGTGWAELVPDPYGAFAPMGGVFSCVSDLARWVAGFTAAFPPGAPGDGGAHPLSRATRREMQLAQVSVPVDGTPLPGAEPADGARGYGFGLFVTETPAWGRIVFHSGGYPGFGSHMRWHPATGLGVIVLANSTYAAASPLAAALLEEVLRATAGPRPQPAVSGPAPAPGGPWPETRQAQRTADQLLRSWDDRAADGLFAGNVALDQPYARRRARAELAWRRIGPPREGEPRPAEYDSPAHCRWWLAGEHGTTSAELKMTAEQPPRVQLLTVTVPPDPGSALGQSVQALVTLLNSLPYAPSARWPASLPVDGGTDTGRLMRRLRMAAAWAGPCRAGAWRGGDGETSTAVELDGEHARILLAVALTPDGRLRRLDLTLPA